MKFLNYNTCPEKQENRFTNNGLFLTTNEYLYDLNRNLTKDLNKQIDNIDYNNLDLPKHIYMIPCENNTIYYLYSADGINYKNPLPAADYKYKGLLQYEQK